MQKANLLWHFGDDRRKGLFVPVKWIFLGRDAAFSKRNQTTQPTEKKSVAKILFRENQPK
jgi:hypothetical protein